MLTCESYFGENCRLFFGHGVDHLLRLCRVCLCSRLQKPLRLGKACCNAEFKPLPARNVTVRLVQLYRSPHVEKELRVDLTFKPHIIKTAQQWMQQHTPDPWKDREFVRVLIHVRRTDYLRRHDYIKTTADYFRQSMAYFTDCLERVQFVVLSDDLKWCKRNLKASNIVFSSRHSPIVDMAIASLCDHAIITVGTFGHWAAWFANGVTIFQKRPKSDGTAPSNRSLATMPGVSPHH